MPPEVLRFFSQLTPTAYGVWAIFGMGLIWWIRGIPERRRARDEGDNSLRKDLLGRIETLERERALDRRDRERERRECNDEQDRLRQLIRDQEKAIDGLQRQFILFQLTVGQAIPPDKMTPEIKAMIGRLGPILRKAGDRE